MLQRRNEVPIARDLCVLQVDASCFDEGFLNFGCVIKDHDIKIVLALSQKELITADPTITEILAIKWSLQLAKELNVKKILIQSLFREILILYV